MVIVVVVAAAADYKSSGKSIVPHSFKG
jgi:hypothetical protein